MSETTNHSRVVAKGEGALNDDHLNKWLRKVT